MSRRGLGRCPNCFLGPVVSAVSRPSRFGFAETLVLVAMISSSKKPWVPRYFPRVLWSMMVVVTSPLPVRFWSSGHGMARRSSSTLMTFSFGHF